MPEPAAASPAIRLREVTKIYRVFEHPFDQALDVFGLHRLLPWRRPRFSEVHALRQVDLELGRGERLALIGRNGAGKTTLLKLLTGNFMPTSGHVEVNGSVQALMNVGLGFHPEFSGIENIRSSMLYNGLPPERLEQAVAEVVDFVELGDFLHQPMKNYSLGMKARLMFATATAVQPDILVVDEILGAGDAYFSARSAVRMRSLVESGCTVLIVSHAMEQVLQYCDQAVWLEAGRVVMRGEALSVVKAYEEFVHELEEARAQRDREPAAAVRERDADAPGWLDRHLLEQVIGRRLLEGEAAPLAASSGGVSRWKGTPGLRIESVAFRDADGKERVRFRQGDALRVDLVMRAERADRFPCHVFLALFGADGRWLGRFASPPLDFALQEGETRTVSLLLEPLQLGRGEFVWSVALYERLDLGRLSDARHYDVLTRSFRIEVETEHRDDPSVFEHPHRWQVDAADAPGR